MIGVVIVEFQRSGLQIQQLVGESLVVFFASKNNQPINLKHGPEPGIIIESSNHSMMTQGFSAGKRINFSVVKIVKIEINHMNGVLSSLPFIKTPMNECNVTDHAGNVML